MPPLNYHHLRSFWLVAQAGSVRAAAAQHHVSQATLSEQVRLLEDSLGVPLFRRTGRQLVLTEHGKHACDCAEQIFAMGRALTESLHLDTAARPLRTVIGTADSLPKRLIWEVIAPVFALERPVQVVCRDGRTAELLEALCAWRIDLVLTDEPAPSALPVPVYSHAVAESTVTLCAVPPLAAKLRRGFPASLDGAPLLLPDHGSALRTAVDRWLGEASVRPNVVFACDDSALLKTAAAGGLGAVPLPTRMLATAGETFGFEPVGELNGCRVTYFLLHPQRKARHPAVAAVLGGQASM